MIYMVNNHNIYVVVSNLSTTIEMKLNKNLTVGYFCTKP